MSKTQTTTYEYRCDLCGKVTCTATRYPDDDGLYSVTLGKGSRTREMEVCNDCLSKPISSLRPDELVTCDDDDEEERRIWGPQ